MIGPALLLVVLAATPAQRLEAERLARQSITDYNVGDFDAALREATQAYKLDPRPALLFNLGQVHRALHHWERAEFFFRGYLRGRPDAPNRAAVEKLIQEMEARQAETARPAPAPTVTVTPAPAPPPATVPAAPAQVPLVIASPAPPAPDAPAQAAPPQGPELAAPAQERRTITAAEPGVSGEAAPPEVQIRSHVASYVLGGVAIAAAGFAVAGLVERLQYDSWVNRATNNPGTQTYAQAPLSQNQANIWTVSAYVLAGLTAAGAAGAIIAW